MYEYILAFLSGDETITLLCVEPLNCTLHDLLLPPKKINCYVKNDIKNIT
jgi:hypothetical protein